LIDFYQKIPGKANIRILSLDGGGVRGVIPIYILTQIETLTGYKVLLSSHFHNKIFSFWFFFLCETQDFYFTSIFCLSLSLSPLYDFQIRQLFDLVVGSGIGGVVALIVSVRDYSPNKLLEFFLDYPQKVFKANIFTKIGFWIKYKYENKHLIAAAKELFGEDCSLNNLTGPECALVRVFCQFI
jgi:patatin-like phospholipase/acyl hydrolase